MTGADPDPRAAVEPERERIADERDRTADVRDARADARERDLDRREAALGARSAALRGELAEVAERGYDRVELSRLAVEASQDLLRAAEGDLSRTAATAARSSTRDLREQADVDRQGRPPS